jgi:hypothetical protein
MLFETILNSSFNLLLVSNIQHKYKESAVIIYLYSLRLAEATGLQQVGGIFRVGRVVSPDDSGEHARAPRPDHVYQRRCQIRKWPFTGYHSSYQ